MLIVALVLLPGRADWPVPRWLHLVAVVLKLVGAAVLVVGVVHLGRSLTALPTPADSSVLRTGGLYRFVRHPIYGGLLALAVGATLDSASWPKAVLTAALWVLLTVKARWEERMLAARYPAYPAYAARTPRFVPFLHPKG
ncbi:MAG: isoprenylcysteine carboxylmethyltransferase family protein [Acidimicrobiales bacterium]|nr:isoprenylcysteine carboxylmethyltransferase family protein [Acidimicrobiales bacterium]